MIEKEKERIDDEGIDLLNLLLNLWHHKVLILVLACIAALFMFVKTAFFTDFTYTAYGVLHISNKKDTATEETIQKSDIDTSKSLSSTYIEILNTRVFLKDISADIGNKYTWSQIKRFVTITAIGETELLKISVTTNNANDSYKIAKSIMEKAPDKLISVYKGGEVENVDPPILPETPNDKKIVTKSLLGFVLGFMAGAGYVFLLTFFDRKIHKSEDVVKRYDVSILGEILQ